VKLLVKAAVLALILSATAVLALIHSATTVASASASVDARLSGTFTMVGHINVANNVYGEHVGQHIRRSWSFYPQCSSGVCKRVVLKRLRSSRHIVDTVTLTRQGAGVYSGKSRFSIPLECGGRRVHHGGVVNETITVQITRAVRAGGTRYATGITATYHNPSRYQDTRCPGNIGRDGASYRGHLTVKAIAATTSASYLILTTAGTILHFGPGTFQGDEAAAPHFGRRAEALAVDRKTGGYWILNSNGGVKGFGAPWKGSLAGKLRHARAVAIAAAPDGGYLILTSDGGVRSFGGAKWHGSDRGKLAHGVHAVSLAVNATGGYWVLTSDGGVRGFGAPARGSLRGKLRGHRPVEIAASPHGGYLILSEDGGVHPFGGAKSHGSDRGKLGHGVRARSLTLDPRTSGYWLLRSNGGVDAFHAPWLGSLT